MDAIKLKNKKQWVIDQVNKKGFISYKQVMNVANWDLNNMHSTFRKSVLAECGLVKTSLKGKKGYSLSNKSLAIRLLVSKRSFIAVSDVMELSSWNSNVLNSVFRAANLAKFHIEKVMRGKQLVYVAS